MKNSTETKVTLKSIDAELKRLLEEDLKKFRDSINKHNQGAKQLLAA
ncbi:MAG TPA: hypothetical protein VHB54_02230 [Mucilaginibacter sp.]|nr:hypothetical protein [Mucilaginibacter sp.]HVW12608.1 hypothetical protein [Mucilaginibacter sp.]